MQKTRSFAGFVATPQNRAGFVAVKELAADLLSGRVDQAANPLFVHGPSGTGKSHLVAALASEASGQSALVVTVFDSGQLIPAALTDNAVEDPWQSAASCDLLVLEDLQHLPSWAWQPLAHLLDQRVNRQQLTVCTSGIGPQQLSYRGERWPNRLTSRLVSGLVIGLQPLQAPGRRVLLARLAEGRQLKLTEDVLSWLAEHLTGGGRQLEGTIKQLQQLARGRREPLDIAAVSRQLREQVDAGRPTMERIAHRVSGYFRVEVRHLQSRRRYRNMLLPRQVGMYLARRLTRLPLGQIGAYFGNRDHSTVLHACQKVEEAMEQDAALCGAVRQLHAALA